MRGILVPLRVRWPVTPVRRWRWGRDRNRWWSRRVGESGRTGGPQAAGGTRLGCRIAVTLQVFGSDQDEARAGEVHKWMSAHGAEAHDGSPDPCPHLDSVGTHRDMIANGPFTGGRFVALVDRLPIHSATP